MEELGGWFGDEPHVLDGGVLDGNGQCVARARRRGEVSASGGVDLVIHRRSRRSEGSNRRAATA